MVRFTCPQCDVALKAPAKRAGQKVKCPECGTPVRVPRPETEDAPAAERDEGPRVRARVPAWAWGAGGCGTLVLAVVGCALLVWAVRPGASRGPRDEVQLQGRWKVVDTSIDGVPAVELVAPDEHHLLDQAYLSFEGERMRTFFPKKSDTASFLLTPAERPKQITITWHHRAVDGGVDDGIYEFDGDLLRICWRPRSKGPRPTSFDVRRGDRDVVLFVLRRAS